LQEEHAIQTHHALRVALVLSLFAAATAAAQPSTGSDRPARRGLHGDWDVTFQVGERETDAIISFSRDEEGNSPTPPSLALGIWR
jgi:hypothetical protein